VVVAVRVVVEVVILRTVVVVLVVTVLVVTVDDVTVVREVDLGLCAGMEVVIGKESGIVFVVLVMVLVLSNRAPAPSVRAGMPFDTISLAPETSCDAVHKKRQKRSMLDV